LKEWVVIHKIKALYDEGNGLKIRAIARQLGLSRNTVRKYLRMDEAAIEVRQSHRERRKQLDAYRDYIVTLLRQFPNLSAAKVLYKLQQKDPELKVSGRSVRRYVRRLKETVIQCRKRYYEPVVESVPGVQCQVDGGELRGVLIGGIETTVYFVVFVLSYSRLMYVGLSRRPVDTATFIRLHDEAFRYFGGRPEECVYDQSRLVVLGEQYREVELNQTFAAYATAAGFRIHVCEGYDPESKGKVEAGVKYVKRNGLDGEVFDDWEHLEQHLRQWLDTVANRRVHATTGRVPWVHYEESERSHMQPYLSPACLGQQTPVESRKVDKTGLLSWCANKYSAPRAYQGARVGARAEQATLILTDLESGREIARHRLSQGKGEIIRNSDHYRDKEARIADLEAGIAGLVGDETGARLCALIKATNPRIYKDQLSAVKRLLAAHVPLSRDLLVRLCERPSLTSTACRDYLEAYEADPSRFGPNTPEVVPPATSSVHELERYALITANAGGRP